MVVTDAVVAVASEAGVLLTVLVEGAVFTVDTDLLVVATGLFSTDTFDLFAEFDLFAGVVVKIGFKVVLIVIDVGDVGTEVNVVFLLGIVNVGVVFVADAVEMVWEFEGLVGEGVDVVDVILTSPVVVAGGVVTAGLLTFGVIAVGLVVLVVVVDEAGDATFSGVAVGFIGLVALFDVDAVDGTAAVDVVAGTGDATGDATGEGVDAGDFVILGLR